MATARRGLLLQLIRRELLRLGLGSGPEGRVQEAAAGTGGPSELGASAQAEGPAPTQQQQQEQRKQETQEQVKQEQEQAKQEQREQEQEQAARLAQMAMPSRQELLAAGRGELVEVIGAAGGFAEVGSGTEE